jgi:hypothetical protein
MLRMACVAVQLERRRADSLAENRRLRFEENCPHQVHRVLGVEHTVVDDVEIFQVICIGKAQPVGRRQAIFMRVDQTVRNQFHDPGQRAAALDRVEAHRIDKIVQQFRRALVEDAHLRPQDMIRFVVLFVLSVQLFANHRARLAAVLELLGLDGFFVELRQVMLQNEILMLAQA